MAYNSTVSAPQCISYRLGSPSSGMANGGGGSFLTYSSTADAFATVFASSYFADGYGRGMRKGDLVFYTDMTTSAWSTAFSMGIVTGVTTASTVGVGGGGATVTSLMTS